MNKSIILAIITAIIAFGLTACGKTSNGSAVIGDISPVVTTGTNKTRAEVKAELAVWQAACKADRTLFGCQTENVGTPVVGSNKTRAEVSAELAAFLAACKADPKAEGCPAPSGP